MPVRIDPPEGQQGTERVIQVDFRLRPNKSITPLQAQRLSPEDLFRRLSSRYPDRCNNNVALFFDVAAIRINVPAAARCEQVGGEKILLETVTFCLPRSEQTYEVQRRS
jgi:hypothetical protein